MPTDELPPPVLPDEPAHPRGGLVDWVTTVDHKKVGILYIVTSVGIFLVAGILARIVRLELAQPGLQAVGEDTYNRVFTMHGTMMIFLFAAQVSTGLANSFVPLQIGAADVAFPRLNAMSYWLYLFGALMVLSGFRVSLTLVPGCCGTLAADSCWSPLLAPPGHGGWAMRSSLRSQGRPRGRHPPRHRRPTLYHGGTMNQVRIADPLVSRSVDRAAHLDPDRVRYYAELLDDLLPVAACRTERGLILADGYHRVAAAQTRGSDTMEAEIRDGSAHDALRYAATIGAKQRGLSYEEVMRRLRQRSGGR